MMHGDEIYIRCGMTPASMGGGQHDIDCRRVPRRRRQPVRVLVRFPAVHGRVREMSVGAQTLSR